MQLEKLIVKKTVPDDEIIREIPFKKGLNLITDITTDVPQNSGNSVGKTTVLKVIDLCLGAKSIKSLYSDNDTNTENEEIKKLLKDHKVMAILTFDNGISISRYLYPNGPHFINNKRLKNKEFLQTLKEVLFNSNTANPSGRQLLNRFIRIDNKQLDNLIDYLDGYQAKDEMESIHLTLLNAVDKMTVNRKMICEKKIREFSDILDQLAMENRNSSLASLQQRLKIIESEIIEKTERREKIDYIYEYKDEINKRSEVLNKLDIIFSKIECMKFDISIMEESIQEINDDKCNIDLGKLRSLYDEAMNNIEKIDKKYEQLIEFHNKMINNRIIFIKKRLNKKKEQLARLNIEQERLLEEKQILSKSLVDQNLLSDLNALSTQIDQLNIQKGATERSIELYENYNRKIKKYQEELLKLSPYNNALIEKKIDVFNKYFSKYSDDLYREKYRLVYNKDWNPNKKNSYPFSIAHVYGEVGTGKKRVLVIAFDLAYLDFIMEEKMYSPQFIIHDKLESIHINQLRTIFNLCNDITGQFIVPILKERINTIDNDIIEKATILTLSQDDKFFKVE